MVVRMPGVYALYAFRSEIDKPVQFPEIGFLVGELDVGKGNEPLRIFAACAEYCVVAGPCSLNVRTVAESCDAFVPFAVFKNMDPVNLDRPARSFQKLKFVIAHLGTGFWRLQAAEMIKLHPNVYADLAGCGSWQALSAEELTKQFRSMVSVSAE